MLPYTAIRVKGSRDIYRYLAQKLARSSNVFAQHRKIFEHLQLHACIKASTNTSQTCRYQSIARYRLSNNFQKTFKMSSEKTYETTSRSKWTKEQLSETLNDAEARATELEQEKEDLAARVQELEAREARLRQREQALEWREEQMEGMLIEANQKGVKLAGVVLEQSLLQDILIGEENEQ